MLPIQRFGPLLVLSVMVSVTTVQAQGTTGVYGTDDSKSTAIGGGIGGGAAIGFVLVILYVFLQLMKESPMSSAAYRPKFMFDPLHYVEVFVHNKLYWLMLLQLLTIVGLGMALGDSKENLWIWAYGAIPLDQRLMLIGLQKGTYFTEIVDSYITGMGSLCDSSFPVCPYECEGTGKAATALLAFAMIFTVLSFLFTIKRAFLGDSMVYYKVTYPLMYFTALYTAVACGIHGGWCFYALNELLKGTSMDPHHAAGFGAALAAFIFSLWAGMLSQKFTYLTYAPTTGGAGTQVV